MATDKRLEKIRKAFKLSGEPSLNPMDYKSSLVQVLNYYNVNYDNRQKRKWFEDYLDSKDIKASLDHIHDREFKVCGSLARLVLVEAALEEKELKLLDDEVERLLNFKEKKVSRFESEEVEQPKKPEVDRNLQKAKEVLADFDGFLDDYTLERKMPNLEAYIRQTNMPGGVGTIVASKLQKKIAELQEVLRGEDKLLVDGWSNFTRTEIKKFLSIHTQMVELCSQAKRIVNRKPTQRKEVSPAIMVSKLKYKIKDDELNMRSVPPAGIIGATEVFVYHVEARKLQRYVAVDGMTLTVKGTTILNFDEQKSYQKTIRKPENIRSLENQGKRFFNNFLKEIKSVEGRVNGRMNDGFLILGTFK